MESLFFTVGLDGCQKPVAPNAQHLGSWTLKREDVFRLLATPQRGLSAPTPTIPSAPRIVLKPMIKCPPKCTRLFNSTWAQTSGDDPLFESKSSNDTIATFATYIALPSVIVACFLCRPTSGDVPSREEPVPAPKVAGGRFGPLFEHLPITCPRALALARFRAVLESALTRPRM